MVLETILSPPNDLLSKVDCNEENERSNEADTRRGIVTLDTINENVKKMDFALLGPLIVRACELERQLVNSSPSSKRPPFDAMLWANIGDCHAVGQKPLTFLRQVLACATDTSLLEDGSGPYPADVKARAKELLESCGGGSVGAYSDPAGVEIIRRHAAEYIQARDGIHADWRSIFLTNGASEGIRAVMGLVNTGATDGKPSGVMIPIPQYPVYSATISEYGMHPIPYYLDEANQWSLNIDELKRSIDKARGKCVPKAIVVINPGNPTGSVLNYQNIVDIITFAKSEGLLIIADEVYQHNIWDGQFHSFKKVMHDMKVNLGLASVMSASKGYMGECGLRAGYCELVNFDPSVTAMFLKLLWTRLCPSVLGQIALDCIVKPPSKTDESFYLYENEKSQVLSALKYRAQLVADTFNAIPGVSSNKVAGAMYAFPKITIPPKAIQKAAELKQEPDFFYAMQLLEATGICIAPGSAFGQLPGTFHFRTTILPPNDKLQHMMSAFRNFHLKFTEQYS